MIDPIELPLRSPRIFVEINLFTGHIRGEKTMTPEMAIRINNYNHMIETGYKWLWNNQNDFNSALNSDSALEIRG